MCSVVRVDGLGSDVDVACGHWEGRCVPVCHQQMVTAEVNLFWIVADGEGVVKDSPDLFDQKTYIYCCGEILRTLKVVEAWSGSSTDQFLHSVCFQKEVKLISQGINTDSEPN